MRRAGTMTLLTQARIAACTFAFLTLASPAAAQRARAARAPAPTPTTTLERIRATGHIRLGYRADARPFSFRDNAGTADGFTAALCQRVAAAVKLELGLTTLAVDWVPVTAEDRFSALQQGRVDLLCGPETETLARRKDVAFSIPVFPGGIGALLRTNSPQRLREVLGMRPSSRPTWRASAGQLLQTQRFTTVRGTTAGPWLAGKMNEFQLTARVVQSDDYASGVQQLLDNKADVLFADRAILLDAVARNPSRRQLMVLDRYFTYEAQALALRLGDEPFRLVVDRTLSRLYAAPEFRALYAQWFGQPDDAALTFYRWNARPE